MSEFTQRARPDQRRRSSSTAGSSRTTSARLAGEVSPPAITTAARPMTLCEKILAAHAIVDAKAGQARRARGEAGRRVLRAHRRALLARVRDADGRVALPRRARRKTPRSPSPRASSPSAITSPSSISIMPKAHKRHGPRRAGARRSPPCRRRSRSKQGIKLYGEVHRDGKLVGSEAICHNKVIEEIALPGPGRRRHRLAHVHGGRARVLRVRRRLDRHGQRLVHARRARHRPRDGALRPARQAARRRLREGRDAPHPGAAVLQERRRASARCSSSPATASRAMALDERATLTNMAVEAGGFTGIIEADEVVVDYLVKQRGLDADDVRARIVKADPGATYLRDVRASTSSAIAPMVATPGDPRNGVPLRDARTSSGDVKIDIAYGGSCTGGKKADMDMYAARPRATRSKQGKRVAAGRAPLHPVRLAGHPPLRRGEGLPRRLRQGGRRARRPVVRRLHQGGPGRRATRPTR